MGTAGKTIAAVVVGGALVLIKALVQPNSPDLFAAVGSAGWDSIGAALTALAVYLIPNADVTHA